MTPIIGRAMFSLQIIFFMILIYGCATSVDRVEIETIHKEAKRHQKAAGEFLSKSIQFKSVEDYGYKLNPETKKLLDYTFTEAKKMGFKTRMAAEGLVGILEIGDGEETVGVVIHLDVVPAGKEAGKPWTHPPFSGKVADGAIWGRGAQDDKGALAATLYATKILIDQNLNFKRKLRVILGTKEEKSFEALNEYLKEEPQPDFGIVPDGVFITRGEKGIADLDYTFKGLSQKQDSRDMAVYWGGGTVINTVPGFSYLVIQSKDKMASEKEITALIEEVIAELKSGKSDRIPGLSAPYSANINLLTTEEFAKTYKIKDLPQGDLVLFSLGQESHGSSPWTGKNAIVEVALVASRMQYLQKDAFKNGIDFVSQKVALASYGQAMTNDKGEGIPFAPPSNIAPAPKVPGLEPVHYYGTSLNLGLVNTLRDQDILKLSIDFRTGVGNTNSQILAHSKSSVESFHGIASFQKGVGSHYDSFYQDDNDPLLKMLYESYKRVFPKRPKSTPYVVFSPATTYLKVLKNFSNYGPVDLYPDLSAAFFHQKNERIKVKALTDLISSYADALQTMLQTENPPIREKAKNKPVKEAH